MLLEPTAQVMDLAVAIRCVERGVHAIAHPIRSPTSLAAALEARDLLLARRYGFREVRVTGTPPGLEMSDVRGTWLGVHWAWAPNVIRRLYAGNLTTRSVRNRRCHTRVYGSRVPATEGALCNEQLFVIDAAMELIEWTLAK